MTLRIQDQIADNRDDDVGLCLYRLNAIPTWTSVKMSLFSELLRLTKSGRYLHFKGDFRDYHLERKGQSCIYQIPLNQKGALSKFRGKQVRLICVGKSDLRAGRFFLAKPLLPATKKSLP